MDEQQARGGVKPSVTLQNKRDKRIGQLDGIEIRRSWNWNRIVDNNSRHTNKQIDLPTSAIEKFVAVARCQKNFVQWKWTKKSLLQQTLSSTLRNYIDTSSESNQPEDNMVSDQKIIQVHSLTVNLEREFNQAKTRGVRAVVDHQCRSISQKHSTMQK